MKVAVIGAGATGLTCIKCCKDQGLEPVCFEQEDSIGGLWHFTEEERHSSVYRSTVINTSKEMICFSDFPIPKEYPPFMHHHYIMKYLHSYAEAFDLYKVIRYRTKVIDVKPAFDYEDSGRWEICFQELDKENPDEVQKEVYDAVMLCIGHHAEPSWPTFTGIDEFSGVKIHSHSYKDFKPFENKSVLVIGIGNSGGDIAVELSRHSSRVFLSTRRGAWIMSRLGKGGEPLDQQFGRRWLDLVPKKLLVNYLTKTVNNKFDHEAFGLRPQHDIGAQHPTVNDDLPHRIITGAVIVKPNVTRFTKTGVVFDDGSQVDDLDAVIFCTGYKIGFKFIDPSIVRVNDNEVELYKFVFPPKLAKPTLGVFGCIQSLAALFPLSELQGRWATQVFCGLKHLPPRNVMMQEIKAKMAEMRARYYASKRHTVQVDDVPYADEIAELIGCKPDLWRLLCSDPGLALRCFFGPCTPAQFRLMGPGAWEGAKKAIEDAPGNVIYATKTRVMTRSKDQDARSSGHLILFVLVVLIASVFIAAFW